MTSISGYTRCDCDWFVRATGDVCGECGHDRDQHNIGYGDECLAQEGDAPGDGLPEGVLTGAEQDQAERWTPLREPADSGGDPDPYPGDTRRDVTPCSTAPNLDPESRISGPHRGHGLIGHRWCPGISVTAPNLDGGDRG